MEYKYLLIAYDNYYPSGGMNDLLLKFNTIQELEEYILNCKWFLDFYQIVKTDDFSFVEIKLHYSDTEKKEKIINWIYNNNIVKQE
jgi:hypothetical protein